MKYIVELVECKSRITGRIFYRIAGTNKKLSALDCALMRPYKEPVSHEETENIAFNRGFDLGKREGMERGIKEGKNAAWNLARRLMSSKEITQPDFCRLFGDEHFLRDSIFDGYTIQKVEAKLKRYKPKKPKVIISED